MTNTNCCLLYLNSNLEKGRNLESKFFCTVSFISAVFELLRVITLVYEFNKLFLNQLNLLIQVGNLEINVSSLHLLHRLDDICLKH